MSSSHIIKLLLDNKYFVFSEYKNRRTNRKHYTIRAKTNWMPDAHAKWTELREHFDPDRCRGGKAGITWKYASKKQAEQLIMMAVIKWGLA